MKNTRDTPRKENSDGTEFIGSREGLSAFLADESKVGSIARTRLRASDRVIARVTDGIYRQPGSALRELISNAWDADANRVDVFTDVPRFSSIRVTDDGAGMSYETLARLLTSIGGSAKRTKEARELGVSDKYDTNRTPGGRPFIGKIGIGLFAVSQLARTVKLVTKRSGTNYRLVAEIKIRPFSESDPASQDDGDDDTFANGDVLITRELADDDEAHGTDIFLSDLKPRVREMLRSADRWRDIDEQNEYLKALDFEAASAMRVEVPSYHSGWIAKMPSKGEVTAVLDEPAKYPWEAQDCALTRMTKLVDAVEAEFAESRARPDLAKTLDTYLEMIWTLALSAPVQYIDRHPFDLTSEDETDVYWLSNQSRGKATYVELKPHETIRQAVARRAPGNPNLESGLDAVEGGFSVYVDGIELRRPVRFRFIRPDGRGFMDRSMMFVGRFAPDLSNVAPDLRGGDLAFEAYLFWNGRIVPKENNGVLVRIRGASGALFDPSFFKYQVSEQTRLRQITSELFVDHGLDAALNIDREGFNFAHPHVQLATVWLHRAIKQLTNRHKELGAQRRAGRREEENDAVQSFADKIWLSQRSDEEPPQIQIARDEGSARSIRRDGYMTFSRDKLPILNTGSALQKSERESKAIAIAKILAAFGVFDEKSYTEQQSLINSILAVFYGSSKNE
ncbi:ATP-binding protein [Thalassospiraceae bacterium LMO-JJ14]|nr:ATP-binding protein [Thalassospiraceae bacterium LMO-JJ14]